MKAPPARINTVVHLRAPRANSLSCSLSFSVGGMSYEIKVMRARGRSRGRQSADRQPPPPAAAGRRKSAPRQPRAPAPSPPPSPSSRCAALRCRYVASPRRDVTSVVLVVVEGGEGERRELLAVAVVELVLELDPLHSRGACRRGEGVGEERRDRSGREA